MPWFFIKLRGTNKVDLVEERPSSEWVWRAINSGAYASISQEHATKEEALKTCHTEMCKECKGYIQLNYYGSEEFSKACLCLCCNEWTRRLGEMWKDNILIINGNFYSYGADKPQRESQYAGHGGREFKVRMKATGLEFKTRNLWHGGDIPSFFLDRFPENAEFIAEEARKGMGYL